MDIQERINCQRVYHIVESYQLQGNDSDAFAEYLSSLLEAYPQSLIELALVESLVKAWAEVPMQKGLFFMHKVYNCLQFWRPEAHVLPPIPSGDVEEPSDEGVVPPSINIQADQPAAVNPIIIETILTPAQFEQITGLDSSFVFDPNGQIMMPQSEKC